MYGIACIRSNDSYVAVPLLSQPIDVTRCPASLLAALQVQIAVLIAQNLRTVLSSSRDYTGRQRILPWGAWSGAPGKKSPGSSPGGR